ncbi:phage virion morphogenesis protein [Pseudazoarcus pumilus]|uniref:Phage virion morphogenesis protein n=1 Tax=Pseudazoarcus pumilus TaxID=2067960 RepID=A0A2I6S9F1_9RHOO|nr:phage virion morphogenesis protein [Pseudazoarcus pumilus]AUN95882.1 phage virion morphogenesis protein [Pseudazoarcus pumilus]
MLRIEIDDTEVLAALQALRGRARDMRPAMANIAAALASESERQFQTESGPAGAWPELSQTTKELRERSGTTGRKLQVSGQLAASVQTGFAEAEAWIGSNKPHAAMQHLGGTTSALSMIPGAQIPARPFLPFHPETNQLAPEATRTVLDVLEVYLEDGR